MKNQNTLPYSFLWLVRESKPKKEILVLFSRLRPIYTVLSSARFPPFLGSVAGFEMSGVARVFLEKITEGVR